ncbi:Isopentenyldiphosphate isomerase [Lutibacter oricola]|uniref:Isopentenyldiphosphate isomerase n=1 Tax=Lutibacter oricola TaxID=762486 RepID=A0A1H3FM23_9FLAO|nr:NUDIX domain-containing protein [Lutibacter oricola]SDX91169.1 Isopentenyldiphosphate isomerase [Lutibacter oricola]
MDELVDILNVNGKPSGETCMKSYAHKNGIYHASAHIWIFNNSEEILIQKRASDKDTFPNFWDISVAGHISAGEKPLTSAIREVEEEIGLNVDASQLKFIGTYNKKVIHNKHLIDNELHYIYICKLDLDVKSLKIQAEEVSAIKMIHLNDLIVKVNSNNSNFVPHGKEYFNLVFKNIKKDI